jgi:hypothetical protein
MDKKAYVQLLKISEVQYRFANAINTLYSVNERLPRLLYPKTWVWGRHSVTDKDIKLSRDEARGGAMYVAHSALYVMVIQIDTALEKCFGGDRFSHTDKDIKSASCIARLIRNAFAHDPFHPVWLVPSRMKNKIFRVDRIGVELNTNGLEGKSVKRSHYGGPLALLQLSRFVRKLMVNS